MPRSIILGNGKTLLGFDDNYELRDWYFPYVGQENHVGRHYHKIGFWVDGAFAWFGKSWDLKINYSPEGFIATVSGRSEALGISAEIEDTVYNEENVMVRRVNVKNLGKTKKEVRVFFAQEFPIDEVTYGNTSFYDPRGEVIIHYKGQRVFLINGSTKEKAGFSDFTCGVSNWGTQEGSFRDAEDGRLAQNHIEHGSADSVVGFNLYLEPGGMETLYSWIVVAADIKEAKRLNREVLAKTPAHIIKTTRFFWKAWVEKQEYEWFNLGPEIRDLFGKSLFFLRLLTNTNGLSIASPDSDLLQFGKDTYNYMWPRDGAFVVLALDKAGYSEVTRNFFYTAKDLLSEEGFLMHKYRPDGSLGSSWHSWIANGVLQYPIQEDETALVLFALEQHYEKTHNVEFLEELYNPLVRKMADFLVSFRDSATGLPHPSYDLWEERIGIHTFTVSTVYVGCLAAANMAKILGKKNDCSRYFRTASEIAAASVREMYDTKERRYCRRLYWEGGKWVKDMTPDSSTLYGLLRFGMEKPDSPRLVSTAKDCFSRLSLKTSAGGWARYEKDNYMMIDPDWTRVPGNPWILCTLWRADYLISLAQKSEDLDEPRRIIEWVVRRASASGILSEQIHPTLGTPLSVSPLAWSHAQLVITVLFYLKKMGQIVDRPYIKPFRMSKGC
ncbi:MAG: glycosyl hydrolase, glucoamylase [Parcubacteria group bacterium Gr01-1014_18]|nr:MAG: glycosyl hydrolase, glucoamylase [Parcubacteria group bacterium Greene0416_36]TSC81255.1 MAG: glycosyl hydrolase, glucoamylase [Parcubacteria group bacterium Gr01-1014_18]TSC99277.1 MAG: glycosyl hydrolase, glucoamylase [Parcubacteria group bacterium Greene1014_20]TSD06886.1 MAG: glycosyl hydrolase, glucoamylase [Parcubacteria group bacterium Greene0714_2]